MSVDYDNGLVVGTMIGKEMSLKSGTYPLGSSIYIGDTQFGNLVWGAKESVFYSDPGEDKIQIFRVDSHGNLYIVVGSDSNIINKISPTGTVIWSKNAISVGGEYVMSFTLDSSDNLYVYTRTDIPYLPSDNDLGNDSGYYSKVTMYSSSGNIMKLCYCKGSIDNLTIDNQGNLYGTWVLQNLKYNTVVYSIIKWDNYGGNYDWAYASLTGRPFKGVAVESSGYIYGILDCSYSGGNPISSIILVKLDSNAHLIWSKTKASKPRAIRSDDNGNIYVLYMDAIYLNYVNWDQLASVAKYDSSGSELWHFYSDNGNSFNSMSFSKINNQIFIITNSIPSQNNNTNMYLINSIDGALIAKRVTPFISTAVCDVLGNFYVSHYYDQNSNIRQDIHNAYIYKFNSCDYFYIGPISQELVFITMLSLGNADASKISMGLDDGGELVVHINDRVNGSIKINGTFDNLICDMTLYNLSNHYELKSVINLKGVIKITVASSARYSSSDIGGLTLDIENNTEYPIEISVYNDNQINPRFILGEITGTNTDVKIV